ncbi:MAG TPA: GNAT family N-acetyltransferase [Chthoniobacterales bacterium]|nr:GNAT family N-acetyltransferase [Chthoniobacterales bacterium]
MEIKIRPTNESDRGAIWEVFREVIVAGETYPLDKTISRDEALAYWFQRGAQVYVAERNAESAGEARNTSAARTFPGTLAAPPTAKAREGEILGSYTLHPNQSGGGGHVSNAAFIVARSGRGQGIGRAMGEHCLNEARRLGFRAMQFNFVVSTNESAVRLWQALGMKIVGTLPGAFKHPTRGYVDVYVMFQDL